MSKNTKRWLGIAIAAVLIVALGVAGFVMATAPSEDPVCYTHGDVNGDGKVNKDDAIYLLYASFPGLQDEFPMTQDGKINSDDVVNKDDAIYLLYASFEDLKDEFPLKGEIHSYYDPTWVWDEAAGTAKISFKCGCGTEHAEVAVVTEEQLSAPTCVAAGAKKLTAKASFDGTEYTDSKTVAIPATGEHAVGEASCVNDLECANCDYEVKAPGHSYALINTDEATCTAQAVEHYKCAACGDTKDVTLEGAVGHILSYLEGQDRSTENACEFVKQYECTKCHLVFPGTAETDTYIKHTFITQLTEVTCCQDGARTTLCSLCGEVKETVVLPKDETKHVWDEGVKAEGKITFACMQEGCDATKEEIVADNGKVDTSALTSDTGVNLGDKTSVSMDEAVLESLGNQQITISVEKQDKEEIKGLSEEQKKQIPSDTVYDFSITDEGGAPVENFGDGWITVTLPYELQEGEDIHSIDIWYIDNAGQPARVEGAEYSNGFVTFKTNHFSYYTVTRLTPAERCKRLGSHIEILQEKAATCTEDGYKMTICQRCGEVIDKTIYEKTGHNYTDSIVEATCTEDGLLTQTCKNGTCGHTAAKILPAQGHEMKLDTEKTVAATCDAAGKTVMICGRADCGYTTEKPTVQLTHNYEKSNEKSVAATCSAAGYDIYVCTLCGGEIRKNDTAPLGHDFAEEKAQWEWTSDTTATVTLVCANDKTHTKVLDAVVTKNDDKSQNTSCLGSGSIVYEAAVGYNGKTYADVNEITVDAPGHKPGTAWETSAGQHYNLCTVCGEKLNAEAHAWNEGTVTKEATCAEAGSKIVSCTVCGYEKVQTISATGEHNYVNGVCTGCGIAQSDCRHLPTIRSEITGMDVGICNGFKAIKYSCECGQVMEYEILDLRCELEEGKPEEGKDAYGLAWVKLSATCKNCSMVYSQSTSYNVDLENCIIEHVVRTEMAVNGNSILSAEYVNSSRQHVGVTVVETVDLSDKGFCGEEASAVYKECLCGEFTHVVVNDDCSWEWQVGGMGDQNVYHGRCYICNMQMTEEWNATTAEDDPCLQLEEYIYTYTKNNEVVFTYEDFYASEVHDFRLDTYELLGDSCTDGIVATIACANCDETDEGFTRYHEPIREERIDLSAYGACSSYLSQMTCLCGEQYAECELSYDNGKGCELNWAFDKDTQEEFWMCYECGLQRRERTTFSEKDENCFCIAETLYTFKNAEGQTIATGFRRNETSNHDMKVDAQLAEGADSCEDGIIVRNYCADCTYEHSYESNYHESYLKASYDLSAFDSCVTRVDIYACPCGFQTHADKIGYCQQEWQETFKENQEAWKCVQCGLLETQDLSWPETNDPCLTVLNRVVTFTKEGVETTLRFSYDESIWNHEYIYEMTLNEGATTCEGGWSGIGACQLCGDTVEHENVFWHESYPIGRELISGGKMCGEVYQVTHGCACGQNRETSIQWYGDNRCEFDQRSYSEELDRWVNTCSGCGSYQYTESVETPVEGATCRYEYEQITYYFDVDGNELFDYSYSYSFTRHDAVIQFVNADGTPWTGNSCAEGYFVLRTCGLCGNVEQDYECYTECRNWNLGSEQKYDGAGICGPIAINRSGCPCGAESGISVEYNCRMQYTGWDEATESEIARCTECDAVCYIHSESTPLPDGCQEMVLQRQTFYLGDQLLCEVSIERTRPNHRWIHIYNNRPASCEDGWSYTIVCFRCGESSGSSDIYYDHEYVPTGYYDLSQYGMCGGYLATNGCACGLHVSWNFEESLCRWENMGMDKNGAYTYYCSTCQTYCYRTESGELGENCHFTGTERHQYVRNGETVLDVTLEEAEERHETKWIGLSLVYPGTNCDSGVVITSQCVNCQSISTGYIYGHATMETDSFETVCGSEIRLHSCACGEERYIDKSLACNYNSESSQTGDHTQGSYSWTMECDDCGLSCTEYQTWTSLGDGCRVYMTETDTVVLGNETITATRSYETERHTYGDRQYSLPEGSESCEDGITVTETCTACGHVSTWGTMGHSSNRTYFDLTAYGATCEGALVYYACACGKYVRYDFEDAECKLQQQGTDLWIENVAPEGWQSSTDGDRWFSNYAYTFTCAVTEPKCSLKMRMAEYWLVEDCVATEYQTWEYFDADKNDWVLIDTVKTGEAWAYHEYTEERIEETQADGTLVEGYKYDCADCGSYYYSMHYAYTDRTAKDTVNALDTTGANYNKIWSEVREYTYIYGDMCFVTSSRREYTQNDGVSGWNQETYTYDFVNGCTQTRVFTDSYGTNETFISEHPATTRSWETLKEPTCTQYGQDRWEDICSVCNAVADSHTYETDPWNHNWYNSGVDRYTCNNCGQENENGASDGIILEDFTEKYGNDTDYVIGYWNKDGKDVIMSVCIVLEDGSTEYLRDISFADRTDVVAVSFNKAQADQLAAQAANGATYQLRVNFVSEGIEYAITLDAAAE